MRCIKVFTKFIAPNSQETSTTLWDLYLRVIKSYTGATKTLKEANWQMVQQTDVEEAEDQLPLSQLQAKLRRLP